jgi:hypothetical protein
MVGDRLETKPPEPTPAAAAAAGVTGVGMAPNKLVTKTEDMVSEGARRNDWTVGGDCDGPPDISTLDNDGEGD